MFIDRSSTLKRPPIIRSNPDEACLLLVGQENENNNSDQFCITLLLEEVYHVRCIYQTHTQLITSMTDTDGVLRVHGHEIAVVYYRSGYTPSDYPTPAQWEVRERLEAARCIKVLSAFAVMMISVPTYCSI